MAGAAVAWFVSDLVGGAVTSAVISAGLDLGAAALISSATFIGGAVGLAAGSIASGLVNGAINGSGDSPAGNNSVTAAVAQGILLNTSSTVEPLPVIYGSRKVGGTRCLVEVSGPANEYLHLIIALGEGQVNSIGTVYLDDVPSTDPRFAGSVAIEYFYGTDAQAACASLIAVVPSKWTPAHTGSGVAYLFVTLKYSASVFSGLPTITADVQGRLVYDPRTGTTVFSNNPALCLRDYLTNTRYGRSISTAYIDDAAIIACANHCDELVATPAGTQARYTCDGIVNVNNTAFDNVKSLLSSCRGMLVFSAGIYRLVIDKLTTPGFAFTEDNIIGDWSIANPGRRAKFNRVTAGIYNPANNWQPDFAIQDSTAYRALDNNRLSEGKIDLPFTANMYRGQQLAGLHLKQSRFGLVVRFSAFQVGMRAEVGDVVTITHTTPGWTAKAFRVMQISLTSDDEVEVTCSEYDDTVYNLSTLTTITSVPGNKLPDPFTVLAPTSLTLTSGTTELLVQADGTVTSRIKCVWPAPADIFAGLAEIQAKLSTDSLWQTWARPSAALGVAWLAPVADGLVYNTRIRYQNTIGIQSAWTNGADHTVIGKTAPPATVSNLTIDGKKLSWPGVADLDLEGYRLKFQYGTNLEWGTANPLHTGLITDSPYTMLIVPPGQVTIMIRAVDTTGNESLASAYVITNLGNPLVANVLESYDYRAAIWPGSTVNATLASGNLQATQSDVFYGADASNFYGYDGDVFYSTNYDGMTWISAGWTPSLAAVGSNMTVAWALTGDAVQVLYRPTGPNPFYGADSDLFYGDDAATFYTSVVPAWMPWPGTVVAANQEYQWQVITTNGQTSGLLSAFTVSVDVPDKNLKVNAVSIGAGGTRLTAAIGLFNVIQNIQLTLQGGSTAMLLEIQDKSTSLGPLITAKNSSGTGVAATIDALLQGY